MIPKNGGINMCIEEYNKSMADENILKNTIEEFNECLDKIRLEMQSKTLESPLWLHTEIEFNSNNELNLKFHFHEVIVAEFYSEKEKRVTKTIKKGECTQAVIYREVLGWCEELEIVIEKQGDIISEANKIRLKDIIEKFTLTCMEFLSG